MLGDYITKSGMPFLLPGGALFSDLLYKEKALCENSGLSNQKPLTIKPYPMKIRDEASE
jgi:hypothetical protein